MTDESEQWKLDGLCSKCRKQKYCNKYCKRAELREQQEIASFINEKTGFQSIMNMIYKGGHM